jgi:hypothetical protein
MVNFLKLLANIVTNPTGPTEIVDRSLILKNDLSKLRYISRIRYVIIIFILLWSSMLLYFYFTAKSPEEKKTIEFVNGVIVKTLLLCIFIWLLSVFITVIIPNTKTLLEKIIKLLD